MKLLDNLTGKFSKDKFICGLDIGTSAIKLAKLKLAKDSAQLLSFSVAQADPDLAGALKKIAQTHAVEAAHISFSGSSTVIRYVNFLKMNKDELRQALKFEAQKHIPFSVEEINFDSYILKDNLADSKMFVLLAAVKKDFLNQRKKILDAAGIRVSAIEIDSIALANAFSFNYSGDEDLKDKTVALLNIGASMSNLNIMENGIPCLSRDIHIAGNNFTQKISDILGVDVKAAENLKQEPDKETEPKLAAAVESIFARLAGEIRTSFDYYESQKTASVVKIFLSGGGSKFVGLKDALANLLGIEVEFWDPLKKITLAGSIDAQQAQKLSIQMAVATGLALHT